MANYKKITKIVIPILIILFLLAVFLFWPINTDGTLIKPDQKLAEGKATFLAQKDTSTSQKSQTSLFFLLMI
ncbi:hypothetical protein ACQ9BO_21290 [Flavobacterium sp. P21]|uniref:hypothetical protein n=1 Tax=Flavobacterium sp. P21 TaxID=3423948 RepID=UPI003D67646C